MSNRRIEPLQTHGLTREVWIPPKERFVTYEASDEAWAKPLGLGKVETKPVDLYDVRDQRNKLIGYTSHNPAKYIEEGCMDINVRVADSPSMRRREIWGGEPIDFLKMQPYQTIRLRIYRIDMYGHNYWTWVADICDAELLARAEWIKCIGEDHIHRFASELRFRAYEEFGCTRVAP